MSRIEANGIGIACDFTGPMDAPVVAFSHSISTDMGMWAPQVDALSGSYRILRFDTRGHGASGVSPAPYSLDQLADDLYALLQVLDVERTHLVGLSMGGMIGQTFALKHPEMLHGLVLADTSARMGPESGPIWDERVATARTLGMEAHVEPTIGRWFTPGFISAHPEVVDPVRAMIRRTPVEGYVGCGLAIKELDVLDRLPGISVPTLVMVGDQDPATPVEASRAIHARIPGSRLATIPSASHLSNLEQPKEFNRLLLGFLEGLK